MPKGPARLSGLAIGALQSSDVAKNIIRSKVENMFLRVLRLLVGLGAAIWLAVAVPGSTGTVFAQAADSKPAEKPPAPGPAPAQKTEEYADIQHAMSGPASLSRHRRLGA